VKERKDYRKEGLREGRTLGRKDFRKEGLRELKNIGRRE
jgi:hypothetical protein